MSLDVIDERSVRAFLQTPAVESVVGQLLYDAIIEFFDSVDLIGQFVNNLPLLGPMRQAAGAPG